MLESKKTSLWHCNLTTGSSNQERMVTKSALNEIDKYFFKNSAHSNPKVCTAANPGFIKIQS